MNKEGKKMSVSTATKIYNLSSKPIKKQPIKSLLKNKPIPFSDMSEKARRESIEAMREEES